MTSEQQTAGAEPTTLGYCLQCGGYGRGVYAGTINSNSEAIRGHEKCPKAERSHAGKAPEPVS